MKAAAEEAADKAPKKDSEGEITESTGKLTVVEDADEVVEQVEDEDDEDFDNFGLEETEEDEAYYQDPEDRLEAVCRAKFLKGHPLAYRKVLWQIRGKSYRKALMILEFLSARVTGPVLAALQSAAANAQNNYNMDKSRLYISRCKALKGPYSKRMRMASKGQAKPFWKKQCHVYIWVAEMSDYQLERKG